LGFKRNQKVVFLKRAQAKACGYRAKKHADDSPSLIDNLRKRDVYSQILALEK
jgi:hypothetical protein